MCGLVGFVTEAGYTLATDRKSFITEGLIVDTLRGEDSTGVMYGAPKCTLAGYYKQAVDGYTFTEDDKFKKLRDSVGKHRFMAGHNRAATRGAVTADNAHPFREGDVTLVHNGTLRGDGGLVKTQRELGVASEAPPSLIGQRGTREFRHRAKLFRQRRGVGALGMQGIAGPAWHHSRRGD